MQFRPASFTLVLAKIVVITVFHVFRTTLLEKLSCCFDRFRHIVTLVYFTNGINWSVFLVVQSFGLLLLVAADVWLLDFGSHYCNSFLFLILVIKIFISCLVES